MDEIKVMAEENGIDWNGETRLLSETLARCRLMDMIRNSYEMLPMEELKRFYERVEDGLISYNLIMQKGPESTKGLFGNFGSEERKMEKYLEGRIILTTLFLMARDGNRLPKIFKESVYYDKLKNKSYYDRVIKTIKSDGFEDRLYNFLFGER